MQVLGKPGIKTRGLRSTFIILKLNGVFVPRYSSVRFVDLTALRSVSVPVEPVRFEAMVREQCAQARDVLQNK